MAIMRPEHGVFLSSPILMGVRLYASDALILSILAVNSKSLFSHDVATLLTKRKS
jgi:hypothetical protein